MKVNSVKLNSSNCVEKQTFGRLIIKKTGNKAILYISTLDKSKDGFVDFHDVDNADNWTNIGISPVAERLTEMVRTYGQNSLIQTKKNIRLGIGYVFSNLIKPKAGNLGLDVVALNNLEDSINKGKFSYDKSGVLGFGFENL